jgi:membrane-associated phospholipid phosphatase
MSRQLHSGDLRQFVLSRRTALQGLGVAGVAAALTVPATARARSTQGTELAVSQGTASVLAVRAQDETASPKGWRMWYLPSADAQRPAAPGAVSQAEIDEVIQAQKTITPEMTAAVKKWGTGVAVVPWSNVAVALIAEFALGGGFPQSRIMAPLHTAMHDAAIAAWDAQLAHARPGPAATDSRITPAAGVNPEQSSFPSEHAAVAGAAATVLAYLVEDAVAGRFDELATAAAESRIAAGAAFRSDVEAGLAIGRAVGDLAVARFKTANDVGEWDPATRLTGPGFWQPTPPAMVDPPLFPLQGTRTPWVLERGDQFRPVAPPEYGSAAWQAELETVQEIVANRTFDQHRAAVSWGTSSPLVNLEAWAKELISLTQLGLPQAARVLADLQVAIDDSGIAVWDGKFTFWTSRPITEDPEIVTSIPTPPYPAYPGGYSGGMGAGTTVLGHYFPEASQDLERRAWEAACSRLWAGIHYAVDNDAGLLLGRQVGRMVTSLDRA